MKVQIARDLLDDPSNFEGLDDVVRFFQTGRHLWVIPEAEIPTIEQSGWLTSEPESRGGRRNRDIFEKSVKFAIEAGDSVQDGNDGTQNRCHSMTVAIGSSDVTLAAGLRELAEPARVFVEDSTSDGRFLHCVARAYRRSEILDALDDSRRWMELVHCGGGGNILARVEPILPRIMKQRLLALLDSDRFHRQHESNAVKTAAKIQRKAGIAVRLLRKREVENYLPTARLAELGSQYDSARDAFERLAPDQRDHFDMKEGFKLSSDKFGFGKHERSLYENLSIEDKHALVGGFGPECGRLFAAEISREELDVVCLSDGGSDAERELLDLMLAMEALL